jgi:hypothetical protein
MRVEERAAEVREVGDKDAWVELSLEEAETSVFEASLAQALEAEPLVDVCQFLRLQTVLVGREQQDSENDAPRRHQRRVCSVLSSAVGLLIEGHPLFGFRRATLPLEKWA